MNNLRTTGFRSTAFKSAIAAALLSVTASSAFAETWTLDPALSNVSFGSIKNDSAGESHSIDAVSGNVTSDGVATILLDLGTVETLIDIRNERMAEFVFNNAPRATITAEFEMADVAGLTTGEATTLETFGTLELLGNEIDIDVNFFVMRVSDEKVLVTSEGIVMLNTQDAGIDAGIDKLQELAGLDSITRVSPVTMRFVFNADT